MMRRDLIGETLLQQFRVENFIAAGGMATIYRVWDLMRSVPLAMKVLNADLAADPAFMARFEREAQSLQRLIHPHIVPFYGLYRDGDLTFLLERYIDGPSLDEVLRQRAGRPLSILEAMVFFKALYTSLGYAHNQGIIHCDVKPGNVLIDQGGHVYLTDFGIARYMDAATVTTSSAMGTPLYMAPEQIRGERLSPRADIYALGIVMFELLTGHRPFTGDVDVPPGVGDNISDRVRYQQLYVAPPDPRKLNPTIPASLAQVILRSLAKDPAERFATIQAMADEISRAIGSRFESLPDRLRLDDMLGIAAGPRPGEPVFDLPPEGTVVPPGPGWSAAAPGADMPADAGDYAADPGGWPPAIEDGVPDTVPAAPFGAAQRGAKPGLPVRLRWLAVLVGALLLLGLCGLLVERIVSGARQGQIPPLLTSPAGALPSATAVTSATVAAAASAATSTPPAAATETPAPRLTPTLAAGLANFAVGGQIVTVQQQGGVQRLALVDASTGSSVIVPSVPNVKELEISAPQWSPDGQMLTWISNYNGRQHVVAYALASGQSSPYQLPAGEAYSRVSSPAFLPDGKAISFWGTSGGASYLVTADAVSGVQQNQARLGEYRFMFGWNWQSGRVTFVRPSGDSYKVAVSDGPTGSAQVIDTGGEGYAPAWSNDGQWLAFQSDKNRDPGIDDIWIAHADGSDLHAVTASPDGSWARAPSFSPDGKMIAFVSNRAGSAGQDYGELFVVDLASGQVRQITSTGGRVYDWRPAWRP